MLACAGLRKRSIEKHRDEIRGKKVSAEVVQEQFINKAGKPIEGAYELYLKFEEKKLFIKFMESDISRSDLEPYIGKSGTFIISEKTGLWDTEDPNVQSRFGDYVVIHEILN